MFLVLLSTVLKLLEQAALAIPAQLFKGRLEKLCIVSCRVANRFPKLISSNAEPHQRVLLGHRISCCLLEVLSLL